MICEMIFSICCFIFKKKINQIFTPFQGVGGSKKGAKWEACTKMLATLSDAATPNLKRVKQEHASGTNGHQFPPLGDDVLEVIN